MMAPYNWGRGMFNCIEKVQFFTKLLIDIDKIRYLDEISKNKTVFMMHFFFILRMLYEKNWYISYKIEYAFFSKFCITVADDSNWIHFSDTDVK